MYVVKNEGSWVLFTKSNYLLNRALLNRGLGVLIFGKTARFLEKIHMSKKKLQKILLMKISSRFCFSFVLLPRVSGSRAHT